MNTEFLQACIYQYLDRKVINYEAQLDALRRNFSLKNADTVDIIDYIETRIRFQTAAAMQSDIVQLIALLRGTDL